MVKNHYYPHFKDEAMNSERWCQGPMAYKQQSQDCDPDSVSLEPHSSTLHYSAPFPLPEVPSALCSGIPPQTGITTRLLTLTGRGAIALIASKSSKYETSD